MKILDTPRSGKCGQSVAFQSRYGLCLRQYVPQKGTLTPARQHSCAIFGGNSRKWGGKLSEEQRDRWILAGAQVLSHPRLAQKGPLTGQQYVVTGTLESFSREQARDALEALGAKVSDNVSKKTTGVIVGESPGAKAAKAEQAGVPLLSEEDLKTLIGEP